MPRTKPAAARRRAEQQMARIAEEYRLARAESGHSVTQVANQAGIARSTVDRIEGGADGIGVGTLCAALGAVGLDLVLRTYPSTVGRTRDAGQARIAAALQAVTSNRLAVRLEVSAGEHGRSADMVLFGADEVIHIEIERRIVDLQAQLRSAMRKREALSAAGDRPVRLVLAVLSTTRNRASLAEHRQLVEQHLPATSRDVMRALRKGEALGRDGLLWVRAAR